MSVLFVQPQPLVHSLGCSSLLIAVHLVPDQEDVVRKLGYSSLLIAFLQVPGKGDVLPS